jgi:hypothetical protein
VSRWIEFAATAVKTYRFRADVLEQLARHGVCPHPSTPPELVHEFVSDLYRYELRRLRARLVRGEIPKTGYFDRVVALRRQYPLVSLKPHEFLESDATDRHPPATIPASAGGYGESG